MGWKPLCIDRIREALKISRNPCIAFSGGKDSLVVLDLVRSIRPETPAVFNNTGVEYPETLDFCRTIPNLIETKPGISFWACVKKYGWPINKRYNKSYRGNPCCYFLKEKPAIQVYRAQGFDLCFTGLTAAESRQRMMHLKHRGYLYFASTWGIWKCHPIWDWTPEDVWDYIHERKLAYNKIYDRGAKRVGCGPCTAYLSWKRNMAILNPKMLRQVLKMQGQCQLDFDCEGNVAEACKP